MNTPNKAYLSLFATSIVWGSTWIFGKLLVHEHVPGLFVSALRQLCAGVILLVYFLLIRQNKLPTKEAFKHIALAAFFLLMLGNGVTMWSLSYISGGQAALISSTSPLFVIIVQTVFFKARYSIITFVGMFVALCGVGFVFFDNLSGNIYPPKHFAFGVCLAFIGTLGWACGSVVVAAKRTTIHPIYSTSWQFIISAPILLLLVFCTGNNVPISSFSVTAWSALIYLTIVGSILGFVVFLYTIRNLPMSIASLYAYFIPIVAMVLGAIITGEKLSFKIGVGVMITLAGIYMVNHTTKNKVVEEVVTEPVEHES